MRGLERGAAPDPEAVAALLATACSAAAGRAPRASGSPNGSARRGRCGCATGPDGCSTTHLDRVLHAERDRRLAPLDGLDVTPNRRPN